MILFSGGVESTALLKFHLENSGHEIFAHYIKIHNIESSRIQYEQRAIKTLLPLLQNIRPFDYSESEVNVCNGLTFPHDCDFHFPIGAIAMHHKGCHQLHRAQCLEDSYQHGNGTHTRKFGMQWGFKERRKKLEAFLYSPEKIDDVAPWLPQYEWPKATHMKYLGELAQHTWSCRTPVNDMECGKCHSCIERTAALNGRSAIKDIDN